MPAPCNGQGGGGTGGYPRLGTFQARERGGVPRVHLARMGIHWSPWKSYKFHATCLAGGGWGCALAWVPRFVASIRDFGRGLSACHVSHKVLGVITVMLSVR